MSASSQPEEPNRAEPPLWSIGVAALVILLAPLILYSLGPSGPLREGDTIFSNGEQRATLSPATPPAPAESQATCLLDPGAPLIILQRAEDRADGTLLATVQGTPSGEWPFCQAHAEVILAPHQIFQKPDLLESMKERLKGWFVP